MAEYQPTSGRVIRLACLVCSTDFDYIVQRKGRYARFCSEACREKRGRRAIKPRQCLTCRAEFLPQRRARADVTHGLYCSLPCRPQCERLPPGEADARERMYRQASYARGKGAPVVDHVDWRAIFERDGWVCGICHKPVDPALEGPDEEAACINHIVPLSHGGEHTAENLQCAHWICSSLRADRADGQAENDHIEDRAG